MPGTILSLLMLAGFAMTGGGIYLLAKKRDRKRGILMVAAGVVMFVNVAIWAVPLD
jgi:LPXTG-motif cell wall-anchored protein